MTSWSRLQWLLCLGGGAVAYDHPSVGLMKVLSEGTGNRRPETQCQQGQLTFGGMKTKVQYRGKDTGGLTPEHFALQGASPELGGRPSEVGLDCPLLISWSNFSTCSHPS